MEMTAMLYAVFMFLCGLMMGLLTKKRPIAKITHGPAHNWCKRCKHNHNTGGVLYCNHYALGHCNTSKPTFWESK